jgi:hypothetical protein
LDQFALIKFWLHLVLAFRLILKQSKKMELFSSLHLPCYTIRENLINIKPVHRGQLIFSGVFSN